MSQSGQRDHVPQAGHWMCVEKPRRFSSRITCPPVCQRRGCMAMCSGRLMAPLRLPPLHSSRRSIVPTERQRPVQHAPGHLDQPVLARSGAVPTLQRRRGRAQHQRHPFGRRPGNGHVAGVIARGSLLLERRLVLLVQDDQAQLRRGGEDRAAGAHHHLHLARRRSAASASAARRRSDGCAARPPRRTAQRNRSTVCGVRLISGTSTIACRP